MEFSQGELNRWLNARRCWKNIHREEKPTHILLSIEFLDLYFAMDIVDEDSLPPTDRKEIDDMGKSFLFLRE
jgi:hypothetical protein